MRPYSIVGLILIVLGALALVVRSVTYFTNWGYNNYHALEAQVNIRPIHGFSGTATYSWSKNLDQSVLYKNLVEQRTGKTWYKVFVNAHGTTSGNGNVVLSTFPFIATGSELLTGGRAAVDATISVNGRTINFTSTHLYYDSTRGCVIGHL